MLRKKSFCLQNIILMVTVVLAFYKLCSIYFVNSKFKLICLPFTISFLFSLPQALHSNYKVSVKDLIISLQTIKGIIGSLGILQRFRNTFLRTGMIGIIVYSPPLITLIVNIYKTSKVDRKFHTHHCHVSENGEK